jgi:hypothetical protein
MTSREVFEKVECKEECYGIFCTAHPDKLDTCKKYINYHLEEQNKLMLEALKAIDEAVNDNCIPDAQMMIKNIINQVSGEQEG